MAILDGKRIVLGVTGGIAAYKAADLASKLVQAGARVDVAMTQSATEFITPLTFEAITKQRVHSDVFANWSESDAGHVGLAESVDAIVVAPATANVIAKLATGFADDMLTITCLSATSRGIPLVIAPAMEHHMFLHPATQANLQTLQARGAWIVEPEHGRLASGRTGIGRLATTERIVGTTERALATNGPLAGRTVVVTAGANREAIDPIRMLTNRSTGKMGYAIARAALHAGADVVLISAPTNLQPPEGVQLVPVESAISMLEAVQEHAPSADALVMAAAVADYRPAEVAADKIKKSDDDLVIRLVRNPDILATVGTPGVIRVGFAAETRDHEANALGKLERKNLDMIVSNDARQAMGSDENAVTLYYRDGRIEALGRDAKTGVAEQLIDRIVDLLQRNPTT